jgi:hypothetical protein
MQMNDPTHLEEIERRGLAHLLLPGELRYLGRSEAQALPLARAWERLRLRRRTGVWIIALSGAPHLFIVLASAAIGLAIGLRDLLAGGEAVTWETAWMGSGGVVLLCLGVWLARLVLRTISRLRRPLPSADELGLNRG